MINVRPRLVTLRLFRPPQYAPFFKITASGKQTQSSDSSPPPRRIMSNVKQNLQWLKIVKEYQKKASSSSPKPATSYRKKKVEKTDIPEEMMNYEDPTMKLYYTSSGFEIASPVLLVDGYNMCGYWPKLKKHFSKGDLETARQKLLDELITFSAIKGVKVVVVFDAMLSGLTTRKETLQNIDVVYTVDSNADSWIEKEVGMLLADGCPKVWVVSSDTLHQHAAFGAGAYIWNCNVLIAEIKDAKKELQELLHDDSKYSVKGKLLEHNLDSQTVTALQDLKKQLKNPGTG
ncbi:hypothetical protein R1sor_017668 [Riccia sorocarpa]|uniref:NYN domain-containing protein n=1 Tax=Riccia sorocarpa TaxID=122646 RepID=A0ABD3I8M1_9MARC